MKRLYAPWRTAYTQKASARIDSNSAECCVFCVQCAENDDEKFFILKRYPHCVIMLNTFPYNAGHLLIVPYQHCATLHTLDAVVRSEIIELVSHAIDILQKVLKPDGFNIGINIGQAAGGSIPSHIHTHVLPRWFGDTNFLPTLGDTKQISIDLHIVFSQLKALFL